MKDEATRANLTRPIIGIENRTAQEAFDIMADRIRGSQRFSNAQPAAESGEDWVLVPRVPTEAMLEALGNGEARKWAQGTWQIMLAAAPNAGGSEA